MKRYNKLHAFVGLIFACSFLFAACEQDLLLYDINQKDGVYFDTLDEEKPDSLYATFGPEGGIELDFPIPLHILGTPKDADRTISFFIDTEKTTAVEGVNYEIGEAVLKGGEVNLNIPLKFMVPPGNEGDDTVYKLVLVLNETDDFAPMINDTINISFNGLIGPPNFWHIDIFGPFSQKLLTKFYELFRSMENEVPVLYNDIITDYGYYLTEDNVNFDSEGNSSIYPGEPFGKFYKTLFINYVFNDLYLYYQENPEDGIDVPNPTSWSLQ